MTAIDIAPEAEALAKRIQTLEQSGAAMASRLDACLARLVELERMAGARWLAESAREDLVPEIMLDELVIPMSMRLSASQGFHRLEYGADGQPFRWTGPTAEFGFNGYVNRRRSGVVRLDVLWGGPNMAVAQTRCFVDDEEVVLSAERSGSGWTLRGATPPRNVMRQSAFRFIAPEVFRVAEEGDLIGLAVLGFSYRTRPQERQTDR